MSRLIVTQLHLSTVPGLRRKPGFCVTKSREWAKRNGIDFKDFMRNGIDAEVLTATGDGLALRLVAWARECEARAGG